MAGTTYECHCRGRRRGGFAPATQRPFAVVIVGGIVLATLFTLLLPKLFPWFADEHHTYAGGEG